MLCPHCQSESCRRSRRRGLKDLSFTFFGLRPWRCRSCEERFYAWTVAAVYVRHAHCPKCGNFDLQRISRDRVDEGYLILLWRLFGFHAYRCDPCRTKFFSLRKLHRIVAVPSETIASHSAHSARTSRANVT
jgi:predicted RNA-binding Zn-ribbon protein involved in translation (DUF1610 family)